MLGRLYVAWLSLLCMLCLTSSVSPWHILHTDSFFSSFLSPEILPILFCSALYDTSSITATGLHTVYRYSAASLVYRESYRISRATHGETLSQKRKRSKDACSCFCSMYIVEKSKTQVQLAGEKQNQWRLKI